MTPTATERHRSLQAIIEAHELPTALASALGESRALSANERKQIVRLTRQHGDRSYSHLLFLLTHHWFAPRTAKALWAKIQNHRAELAATLRREVSLTVAAFDFLSRQNGRLKSLTQSETPSSQIVLDIALRDPLTELFSFSAFKAYLEIEIKRLRRRGGSFAVLMLDLDGFKAINDRAGHLEGDRILRAVAAVMASTVREEDICARWGGDEFALLLGRSTRRQAREAAERLRHAIEVASLEGSELTVSIGVAVCPRDGKSAPTLMRQADLAMYAAKQRGGNQVCAAPVRPASRHEAEPGAVDG